MPIDWSQGQLLTLTTGQTATCGTLISPQLYGIFLYNSGFEDANVPLMVTWSNRQNPVPITVPGTTADQGLAWVVLVSGRDTTTVSVAIGGTADARIDCFLCSVSMPLDTTGLDNLELPINGQLHPFKKYTRYHQVPPSWWLQLSIEDKTSEFLSVQFRDSFARFNVVNPSSNVEQRITAIGSVQKGVDYEIYKATSPPQIASYSVQGDGSTWVWMSADSEQNSENSTIAFQSLTLK